MLPQTKGYVYFRDILSRDMRQLYVIVPMLLAGQLVGQQPGTLDSTFSDDGVLVLSESFLGGFVHGQSMTLFHVDDSLGQHFVSYSDSVVRFLAVTEAGMVDTSSSGAFYIMDSGALGSYGNIQVRRVFAIDERAHAVLKSDSGLHMIRFSLDGQLDTAFGPGGGVLQLDWERFNEQSFDSLLELQDGGYLLSGYYRELIPPFNDHQRNCYFIRLNGSFEPSMDFGSNGALVLYGSSTPNYPYYSVRGVGELSDSTLAVGLYYNVYGPGVYGSSSVLLISRNGVILGQSSVECGSSSPWLAAFHVTCQDVLMYSVANCSVAMEGMDTLYQSYSLDFTPQDVFSDDQGVLYTVTQGWRVARRLPSGEFDDQFGEYVIGDGYTYSAQLPTAPGTVKGMVVLPDGKLLSWGNGYTDATRVIMTRHHNLPDPRAKLSLRLFLGGAYEPGVGLMRDALRQQGLVPDSQPYSEPDYVPVGGLPTCVISQEVLGWTGDSAVVDWVWMELLDPADSITVLATRSGLVLRDGTVTQADGCSVIDFRAGAGSYFLRVRHRNHLGAMVHDPITLSDTVVHVDLTDPATLCFGTEAQEELNGVQLLWPGDASGDGIVRYSGALNDRDEVLLTVGGSPPTAITNGYSDADVNLDGLVRYAGASNDRDLILQTIGGTSPISIREEQRP